MWLVGNRIFSFLSYLVYTVVGMPFMYTLRHGFDRLSKMYCIIGTSETSSATSDFGV